MEGWRIEAPKAANIHMHATVEFCGLHQSVRPSPSTAGAFHNARTGSWFHLEPALGQSSSSSARAFQHAHVCHILTASISEPLARAPPSMQRSCARALSLCYPHAAPPCPRRAQHQVPTARRVPTRDSGTRVCPARRRHPTDSPTHQTLLGARRRKALAL